MVVREKGEDGEVVEVEVEVKEEEKEEVISEEAALMVMLAITVMRSAEPD